jgi:hypothetical protein
MDRTLFEQPKTPVLSEDGLLRYGVEGVLVLMFMCLSPQTLSKPQSYFPRKFSTED